MDLPGTALPELSRVTGIITRRLDPHLIKKSKQLSWLLRHGAYAQGLAMDQAGWMDVNDLLTFFNISRDELELIVSTDNKRRFQLVGQRVRACQGHSGANRLVSLEALEASWFEYVGVETLWHGTQVANVEQIAREGILPMNRTHVHLAPDLNSIVGKNFNASVMLGISTFRIRESAIGIFVAPNGVVLVRSVPVNAIIQLIALSKAAKSQEVELKRRLALE